MGGARRVDGARPPQPVPSEGVILLGGALFRGQRPLQVAGQHPTPPPPTYARARVCNGWAFFMKTRLAPLPPPPRGITVIGVVVRERNRNCSVVNFRTSPLSDVCSFDNYADISHHPKAGLSLKPFWSSTWCSNTISYIKIKRRVY